MSENCCKNCTHTRGYTGYTEFFCEGLDCYIRGEQYDCRKFSDKHAKVSKPVCAERTAKLDTCPFCGSEAEIIEDKDHTFKIICKNVNCFAEYGWCDSKEKAIKGWNKRSTHGHEKGKRRHKR